MHRVLVSLSGVFLAGLSSSQVTGPDAAVRRAEDFLREIGSTRQPVSAARMERGPRDPVSWKVDSEGQGVSVRIDEGSGKVVSFVDSALMLRASNRAPGPSSNEVSTVEQAWKTGDRVLVAAGLNPLIYRPVGSSWIQAGVGEIELEYGQSAPEFEGSVNTASVWLDSVDGRVTRFTATVHRVFVPPRSVTSRDEAAEAVRRALAAASVSQRAEAVSEEVFREEIALRLLEPFDASSEDASGAEVVRAAWTFDHPDFQIAVDAETGAPIFATERLVRSYVQGGRIHEATAMAPMNVPAFATRPTVPRQAVGAAAAVLFVLGYVLLRRPRPPKDQER